MRPDFSRILILLARAEAMLDFRTRLDYGYALCGSIRCEALLITGCPMEGWS